jgi:hypothetical protein
MSSRARIFVIRVLFLLVLAAGFPLYFCYSHAVPMGKYAQVENGMTMAQVAVLLGAPDSVRHDSPFQCDVFCYGGGFLKFCTVEILFGSDGHVVGKFHDH